jgi:hypothetical protein
MQGQWLGNFAGTNTGEAIIELDEVGDHYEGRAYVFDNRVELPSTWAFLHLPKGAAAHSIDPLLLYPIDPRTLDFVTSDHIAQTYPDVTFPRSATTNWDLSEHEIRVRWQTNIGTHGEAVLSKVDGRRASELVPININNWEEFRGYVRGLPAYKFMFRGQGSNQWRLRTAFHRTKRSDVVRFLQVDVGALHQHISSLTDHFFNLNNPIENGAFVSLVQHHGYPTPLLDWTYSPFIAAYFALRYAANDAEKVRVFIFDRELWRGDWNQVQKVAPARLHFSMLDAVALNNPRMVPQQALSTVTNAEDIESYIAQKAAERPGRQYLHVIDLHIDQREEALRELSAMGITPGSVFPGLDGACAQLKDRFFGF